MTRRAVVAALAAIVLLSGAAVIAFVSPPRILSLIDAAAGGGRGVTHVATVEYGQAGQSLDIWRPARADPGLKPVVIFLHGGGWAMGNRTDYAFAGRAFAARGFVAIVPDYRKPRFEDFMADAAAAVAWTRLSAARYGGDASRIALVGHSAGAHMAVLLALDGSHLQAVGVDPATIGAVVGLAGPYDFHPFTSPRAETAMGHVADPRTTQPIAYARADAPPMLLLTGDRDDVVKPRNSLALGKALYDLGAPVTVRRYPRLDHEDVVMALSRPFERKGTVLADSVSFLNRTLRPTLD